MGKPAGQDGLNGKPNIVAAIGIAGALKRLRALVETAADSVPDCAGRDAFRAMIRSEATRLMPKALAASAARSQCRRRAPEAEPRRSLPCRPGGRVQPRPPRLLFD